MQATRPDFGRLYGITHDKFSRNAMIRAPRVLKVGIGIAKGRAIQVFLHGGTWNIRHGVWEKTGGRDKLVMKTVFKGGAVIDGVQVPNTRAAAEAWHNENKHKAAVSNRPQKLPYFSFTRRTIIEIDGKPSEVFEPDFEAIEAHGDAPRVLPVILTSENPWTAEYAWWSAAELKCHGDGVNALRAISAGNASDENWKAAVDAKEKYFAYSPCYTGGCPHAGVDCKPHGTLNLQLAYAMRIGATAYFTTTSIVSCSQIFSSIAEIRSAIESRGYSIAGIPMNLVLGSFRANFDGKPSIQPCVSLELRAGNRKLLDQILEDNAWVPSRIGTSPRLLAASPGEETVYEEDATPEPVSPVIAAETVVDAEFDDEVEITPPVPKAAAATQAKQDNLADKLRVSVAAVPWGHKPGMMAVLSDERERVGAAAFAVVEEKHGVKVSSLDHADPRAMEIYRDLKALVF